MKAVIVTIALSLLLPSAEAAAADRAASPSAEKSASPARKGSGTRMTIPVEGITCASCAKRLTALLQKLDGVKSVTVSVEQKHAVIEFEPTKFSPDCAIEFINDIGFTAGTPVEG